MAEKDITEKVLMSHADVFADCVNALADGAGCVQRTCSLHRRRAFIGKKEGCTTSSAIKASSGRGAGR